MPMPGLFPAILATLIAGRGGIMADEKGPLNLSGEQYWNFPLDHVGDIGIERLMQDQEGMLIDAPSTVYSDEHRTVPLVCLRTLDKEKAGDFSLATTTEVILSHLETGNIQIFDLQRSPDVKGTGSASKGSFNEWHVADLKELADLNPFLGRYAVWLVCGPETSNTVHFRIYPKRNSETGKDVREKIFSLRIGKAEDIPDKGTQPPFIKTASRRPSGANNSHWSLTREEQGKDKASLRLEFDILGLPRFLRSKEDRVPSASGKKIWGMIPVLLAGFSKDHGLASVENFLIPVLEPPKGPEDAPTLSGAVTIDLHKIPNFNMKDVSYLWAVTMDYRSMLEL